MSAPGGGRGGSGAPGRVDAGDDADDGPQESQHARRQQHRQKLQGGSGVGGPSPRTARKESGGRWGGGEGGRGGDGPTDKAGGGRTGPVTTPVPGEPRSAALIAAGRCRTLRPSGHARRPRPGHAPLRGPLPPRPSASSFPGLRVRGARAVGGERVRGSADGEELGGGTPTHPLPGPPGPPGDGVSQGSGSLKSAPWEPPARGCSSGRAQGKILFFSSPTKCLGWK